MTYIIGLIFNIIGERLKIIGYLSSITLMVILTFLSGYPDSVSTLDYASYYTDYIGATIIGYSSRFEWAYQFVVSIGHALQLEYADFRFWYILGTMILLYIAVLRFVQSENVAFFWTSFALFSFFIETIQLRSFTMFVLVLMGVSFLRKNTLTSYFVAYLFIFLGMGFHSSGAIYLLVPLVNFFVRHQLKVNLFFKAWTISFAITILLWMVGTSGITTLLGEWIGQITGNAAVQMNVTSLYNDGGSWWNFIKVILFSMCSLLVVKSYDLTESYQLDSVFGVLMSLMLVSLLGMPLMMVSSQYDRILRAGIMVSMIISSFTIFNVKQITTTKLYYTVLLLVISFIFLGGYAQGIRTPFSNIDRYIGLIK